ncbi:V-type ATP synthase subunit E [Clostridium ganghwense]|uniref:V-type proton ATPase subunit E n=1 Tax=Clostridium ganghwense TaxID=312089 RepID=A0ABT4CP89_9CLOT|nr:V-type ATP synthase subunit E [Clostridium ganghwense]MCY6370842.1 V-type ATP synthase subunit E [Clostridium ganghwense]
MSSINNLTSKIIEDANNTAKGLIEEAKNTEKSLINKKIAEGEAEKKIMVSKAESEAKTRAERIISNAHLQVRNMKLSAKGEVLDNTFNIALEKLNKISKEKLLKFMMESILSLDIDGDEKIIVGENNNAVTPEFIKELNKALIAEGKKGELKLSSEKRDIKGGYILAKNGIEINNTFEALIMSLRDELEAEVISALFN